MPIPRRMEEPGGLMDQLAVVNSYDTTDTTPRISVPTMVIHGGRDIMVEPGEGRRMARAVRGSRILSP